MVDGMGCERLVLGGTSASSPVQFDERIGEQWRWKGPVGVMVDGRWCEGLLLGSNFALSLIKFAEWVAEQCCWKGPVGIVIGGAVIL